MAVKSYTVTDVVQRMTDLYAGLIRYHSSHWQALGGVHSRSHGSLSSDQWTNVPDDTIFITNIFQEIVKDLMAMEHSRPSLAATLVSITASSFITAAQTQFAG